MSVILESATVRAEGLRAASEAKQQLPWQKFCHKSVQWGHDPMNGDVIYSACMRLFSCNGLGMGQLLNSKVSLDSRRFITTSVDQLMSWLCLDMLPYCHHQPRGTYLRFSEQFKAGQNGSRSKGGIP